MKCPKCSYISFDYNQFCPKCNKDLSYERNKLNLPSYKPKPPFLLSALIGELSDSSSNMEIPEAEKANAFEAKPGISLEDSQAIETMGIAFQDSQDLDIHLEPEPTSTSNITQETSLEAPLEETTGNLNFPMEDLTFEDSETDATQAGEMTGNEIVLETALSPDEPELTIEGDNDNLSLDLESLEFDLETEKPEGK